MSVGRTFLITIEMLAASIWVGSLVALALVADVARRDLDEASRVVLFRGVGRLYGVVGTTALLLAIAAGVAIAWPPSELGPTGTAALVLAGLIVVLTAAGMTQARRMTARRRRALAEPHDERAGQAIRRGAVIASVLRGSIALVTLVVLVLGADLLDR